MHAEILVAALVLVVAVLVAADFFRRTGDSPHEHVDRPAQDAGRQVFAADGRRAPDTGQALPRPGSHGVQTAWLVRTRLSLLAVASAAAAALATAGVLRAAGALRSAAYHSNVSSVRDGAIASAVVACIAVVVALAAGLWSATLLIRSVLRPLHQLRAAVVELAEVRLPDALRHISRAGSEGRPVGVNTIGLSSPDEIGDVARAFDQVQGDVLRLAANEAGLRGRLSDMFVELSGRSQSLVERQIQLIDELEHGEQDTERLAGLFRMDHIATRMRRHSQNLLVLAGHELPGRRSHPVTLVDVIRAAASEIEEYERVSLSAQPGIAVAGPAVNDVVHLLAELAENAASLSAADTPVDITGRTLASGGVLVDVTDQGVGMNPEQMAQANWRLEHPPAADMAVSRNMGLFVVARLAARHGIKVRLQPAPSGGLSALVWLPDAIVIPQHQAAALGPPGVTEPDRGPAERAAIARSPSPAPTPQDVLMRQPSPANPVPVAGRGPRHAWSAGASRPDFRSGPPARSHQPPARSQPPAADATPDPEADPAETGRLPIYEAVESGWFGNRREQSGDTPAVEGSGASPVDRGWRAAETVMTPSSGGVTTSGLPVRVPRANLVPGAISGSPAAPAAPRSATAARDRLAGFQRGAGQGRAAVSAVARPDAEDEARRP
jgi:signal transduction histidine kinase